MSRREMALRPPSVVMADREKFEEREKEKE